MALADNIVAYWKLDESSGNASDSVGGFTLTNNGTTPYASALINNGADFGTSNTTKSLSIGNNLGVTNNTAFSISFWYKRPSEITSGTQVLARFATTNGASRGVQFQYDYNGGTIQIQGYTGNILSYNTSFGTSFHHIVFTRAGGDGSATGLYIDGVSRATGTSGTDTLGGADMTRLGGGTSGSAEGIIDEVGVWTRVITSGEVTSLYNSGSGIQYPFSNPSASPSISPSVSPSSSLSPSVSPSTSVSPSASQSPSPSSSVSPSSSFSPSISPSVSVSPSTSPSLSPSTSVSPSSSVSPSPSPSPAQWTNSTKHTSTYTNGTLHSSSWTNRIRN